MSDDEMRIAIAEELDYERLVIDYESLTAEPGLQAGPDGVWRTPSANKWLEQIKAQEVQCVGNYFVHTATGKIYADFDGPDNGVNGKWNFDFLNDLNAMHDAEHGLRGLDLWKYLNALREVTHVNISTYEPERLVCATARQRAEAFLKVKGRL